MQFWATKSLNLMQSGEWKELCITNFHSCVFRCKSDYKLWSDKEIYWSREERMLVFSARTTGSSQVDLIWCPWAICHPSQVKCSVHFALGLVCPSLSDWGCWGSGFTTGGASLHQEQVPSTPYIAQRRLFWWDLGWVIPEIGLLKD